jgi:hypothetical protein
LFTEEYNRFIKDCEKRATSYKDDKGIDSDVISEVLVEYEGDYPKSLQEIMSKIPASSSFGRGAIYAIARFRDFLLKIDELRNKYEQNT